MALKRKKKIEITADNEGGENEPPQDDMVVRDADFSQLEESDENENGCGGEDCSDSAEVARLKDEVDSHRQNYLRALADLENFKKRAQRERAELLKYQGDKILFDMVEILDNLDLAIEHAEADPEKLRDGVKLIHKMFLDALSRWGVRGESGAGEPFDPNKHAAISQIPTDEVEPGIILNELKKAYFYKERLLRAGEVVVASAPVEADPAADEEVAATDCDSVQSGEGD